VFSAPVILFSVFSGIKELICWTCAASIQQYSPQCVLVIRGKHNHQTNRQKTR
jgi:hypothetical protein